MLVSEYCPNYSSELGTAGRDFLLLGGVACVSPVTLLHVNVLISEALFYVHPNSSFFSLQPSLVEFFQLPF